MISADFAANLLILAAIMFGISAACSLAGIAYWIWQRWIRPPRNRYLTQREYEQLIRHYIDGENK